jgi:predicted ester cyclase
MQANLDAVERARRCWNAGDLAGYLELYDDSIRLHGYSPEAMDKAAASAFYEDVFAAFDSPQLEFEDTFAVGDRVVVRFTMTGRHVGAFLGVPATGTEVALPGITILRFGAGAKTIERWSCADMLGLLVQLGAVPAPG